MVTSNSGRSVHDETQGYDDSPKVDEIGLGSKGFDYDPKEVTGAENVSVDHSGYGTRERDWTTQGEFGFPEVYTDEDGEIRVTHEEVMNVFADLMDTPAEELEENRKTVTDGGTPRMAGPMGPGTVGPSREYETDGGISQEHQEAYNNHVPALMAEVDHEGPYGDDEEGGAPW